MAPSITQRIILTSMRIQNSSHHRMLIWRADTGLITRRRPFLPAWTSLLRTLLLLPAPLHHLHVLIRPVL
jgi:hypothetical protein